MIFDVILVLVFLVLIIINTVRGAAKSLAGILASILSYIAATALGKILAGWIYDSLLRPAISKAVTDAVSSVSADAAGSIADALPSWLTGLLNVSGGDLTKLLSDPISGVGSTVAQAVDNAIQPAANGILTFFITIILFLLLAIILRFLITKPLVRLFRFPILNGVNRLLGAAIGFVHAFLLVSMMAYLTKLILAHMSSQPGWFSESTIYNSFIFYHFYSGNIFTWISSALTG